MVVLFAILLSVLLALADPPAQRPADSTYFNISFQAQEALARTERQVVDGNWPAAARAFQEIGEKFGDSVIASTPRQYISVRDFVNRKIAGWPPEGLAAYRTAYEGVAKRTLADFHANSSTSIEPRVRLADRFYATEAGATALDEAAQLAMEAADFDAAHRWYERLLADHPDREQQAAFWNAKLALCRAWQGDLVPLERAIEELGRAAAPLPSHSLLLERLRATLEECRRDGAVEPAPSRPELLGGASHRRGLFPSAASAEARWWRFTAFGRLMTDNVAEGYESSLAKLEAYHRALANGRLLACQPVAAARNSNHIIFVHDARSVWAVDPQNSDRPVWQFDLSQVLPAPAPWNAEESAPPLYTTLHADGQLYVHLEREITDTVSEHVTAASTLVCLDAADGHLLWRNDLEGFVSPFEEARLDGAPLMHRGALYAVARRRKPFGFEACYLLRFDPDDGRLVWSVHLGEAATGSYGYSRATLTHPAAQGDLVFVPTNLGGVTAVSTCTGRVAWAYQYDSRFGANPDAIWPDTAARPLRSWHYNSAILWKDAVVCLPLDAEELLVLAADDGRELIKIPAESLHRPQTLIGLHGDRLYTAGTQVVCYDLASRKIAWQRPLDHGQLFGRGALTTAGLFLPTDRGLLRYPLDGGASRSYRWPIEDAGNLLVLPDQIVVAAPGALYGLVAKEDAFAHLDQRMRDRLHDPIIAFSLAELAFNTGEHQRGLDAVQAAVDRVGGFARLSDETLRRRFFATLTQFATTLLEQTPTDEQSRATNSPAPRLSTAVTLLKLAGQCPPAPTDQAVQRLLLARALLDLGDAAGAVQSYQQILSDRGLRRLKFDLRPELRPAWRTEEEEPSDVPPSELAPKVAGWITRIVKMHGGEVYAPVARQAADRLQIAKAADDTAALLEVADAFPNSAAAHQALVVHADLMAARRDWPVATRSFRRALADRNNADRPDLIRRYADCLVAADRSAAAAAWLDRGARDYPAHRFPHTGPRPLSFSAYRRELLGDRNFCDPAHAIPFSKTIDTYRRLNPDRVAILEPAFPSLPETRWDALLTYSARQLEARHPGTGRGLWSKPFASTAQPVLIGMDESRYVFAAPSRLFALTRTSGQLSWQVGEETPEDPNVDPESTASYSLYFMTPDHVYAATDRGALACVDIKNGNLVWENKSAGPPSGQLVADEKYCCFGVWQAGDHSVTVFDAKTGRLIRHLKADEKGPAQSLHLTSDLGAPGLLVVRPTSIERYDLAAGQSVWKISVPEHFVAATLQLDSDGLMVSTDGRRLTRHDLTDGRMRWRSSPLADEFASLWCQRSGGILYAASDIALFALDADDGRTLWTTPCPAARIIQPPRLLSDRIVVITPEKTAGKKERPREEGPGLAEDEAVQYRIRAFALDTGKAAPLGPDGTILTEPIASFGGLFARENAFILLDGNRLIGYVGNNDE